MKKVGKISGIYIYNVYIDIYYIYFISYKILPLNCTLSKKLKKKIKLRIIFMIKKSQ